MVQLRSNFSSCLSLVDREEFPPETPAGRETETPLKGLKKPPEG